MFLTLLLIQLLLCDMSCSQEDDSSPLKKHMDMDTNSRKELITPHRTFYRDLIPSWAIVGHPLLKLPEESVRELLVILRDAEPAIFAELAENKLCEGQTFPTLPDQSFVISRVKDMDQYHEHVRNETDNSRHHFQYYYSHSALDEADNEVTGSTLKYGMSFIFRFLLEFYMLYRKALDLSINSSRLKRLIATDDGTSYNRALQVMQGKRETPLQFAAPVKRAVDMFKNIINESVKIVQINSSLMFRSWEYAAFHVASLASQASNCSNVWYQAFARLLVLGSKYSFDDTFASKIADVDMIQDLIFDDIFDNLIEKLAAYTHVVSSQLNEVGIFGAIADVKCRGFVNCVSIENVSFLY